MKTESRKAYFRGSPRYGRTTQLLVNGKVVLEVMGIATKTQLLRQYQDGPRCADCGGLELAFRHEHGLWNEKACKPGTCSDWRVVGKSKNGGPLLSVVQDDG